MIDASINSSILTIFLVSILTKKEFYVKNIGYLVMKVSKELRYILTKELKEYDLTTSQWSVLKRLQIEEENNSSFIMRTAVELALKLDFDKPTISGIINRLFEKGMLRKEQHPDDKRAYILFLTPRAKELIPTLELVSNRVIDESLSDFSTEEKEIFIELLTKMDSKLSQEAK